MSEIEISVVGPCGDRHMMHRVSGDTGVCRDCGFINPPRVQWNHIDGPMMSRGNGTVKWLTWRERFMHWMGRWSLEDIARRPSPW